MAAAGPISASAPLHALHLMEKLKAVMYARALQSGRQLTVPLPLETKVKELRTRSYRRLEHGMAVIQNFAVVLSSTYFGYVVHTLLDMEELFADTTPLTAELVVTDLEELDSLANAEEADSSMSFFILQTIHRIVKASSGTTDMSVNSLVFEYLCLQLLNPRSYRRMLEATRCMKIMSDRYLGELCAHIIAKLQNTKLSTAQFVFFQRLVRDFHFGVATVYQRNSTMLYLSYQTQVIDTVSKESLRKEICLSLKHIFTQILNSEDANKQRVWASFCQSDDAQHFWRKFEDIYRSLTKWSKGKKLKHRSTYYDLMSMMLGFGPKPLREAHAEGLLRAVLSQPHKDTAYYEATRDFLFYLKYSEEAHTNEFLHNQFKMIAENFLPRPGEVPDSLEQVDIMVDIGIELADRNMTLIMEKLKVLLAGDVYSPYFKIAGLHIISSVGRTKYSAFCKLYYNIELHSLICDCMEEAKGLKVASLKGSKKFRKGDDESSVAEIQELYMSAAIMCFPHVEPPMDRQIETLEKIAELSLSDMDEISTAALYALRDFMLSDTRLLIHILSIAQRQLTDYFEDDLAKIARAFYNLGSLLYFVNKAVNMGFDFDGVIPSRLALTLSRIEGSALVWLFHSDPQIQQHAWKLEELLSSAQLRSLEKELDGSTHPHLLDTLPRFTGSICSETVLKELMEVLNTSYVQHFLALNYAWSSLYKTAQQSLESGSKNIGLWSGFFKLLWVLPRHPPASATFEEKACYLGRAIDKFFLQIARTLKITKSLREVVVDTLQLLHPSCYNVFICSLKAMEEDPDSFSDVLLLHPSSTKGDSGSEGSSPLSTSLGTSDGSSAAPQRPASERPTRPASERPVAHACAGEDVVDSRSQEPSAQVRRGTMRLLQMVNEKYETSVEFFKKPYILALFAKFICHMPSSTYLEPEHHVEPHFTELLHLWLSGGLTGASKLSLTSKRDLVVIFDRCVRFRQALDEGILPKDVLADTTEPGDRVVYCLRFLKRLLPEESASPSDEQIALECAVLSAISAMVCLEPITNASHAESVESSILKVVSRGPHVLEFGDPCLAVHLQTNPGRMHQFVRYAASHAPSSSLDPSPEEDYCVAVSVVRAIVECLRKDLASFRGHVAQLFLLSLHCQCAYSVVLRDLGISLATIITATPPASKQRKPKAEEALAVRASSGFHEKSPRTKSPRKRVSPRSSCEAPAAEGAAPASSGGVALTDLSLVEFVPCIHADREVYLSLTTSFSREVARKYDSATRSVLWAVVEFSKSLPFVSDIALMLKMMRPWARNYGRIVGQPPRWIIRAVFELCLCYFHNVALVEALEGLLREIVEERPNTSLPMALDWILDHCAQELAKPADVRNLDVLRVGRMAVTTFVQAASASAEKHARFVLSFLVAKLRCFPAEVPVDGAKFLAWHARLCELAEKEGGSAGERHREEAAFLFLVPLCARELTLSYKEHLPLLFHHSFVFYDDAAFGTMLGREQFVSNFLVGLQISCASQELGSKVEAVRTRYFPTASTTEREEHLLDSCLVYSGVSLCTSTAKRKEPSRRDASTAGALPHRSICRLLHLLDQTHPHVRKEWAALAYKWAMHSTDVAIACKSFAIFATLAESLDNEQLYSFVLLTITSLQKQQKEKYKFFSKELCRVIARKWFIIDYSGLALLSSAAFLMVRSDLPDLYKLGLKMVVSLFDGEEKVMALKEQVAPLVRSIWMAGGEEASDEEGNGQGLTLDDRIVAALFRGLEKKDTCRKTLWLMEALYVSYAKEFEEGKSNHLAMVVLLTYHVLVIADPALAKPAKGAIKAVDAKEEFSSIATAVGKFAKGITMAEYLEKFYREFVSVYPDEEDYLFTLRVLLDLLRSNQESVMLAALRALGSFVQLNFIHDVSREMCQLIINKALLCCHCMSDEAVDCVQDVLHFLLTDPRATRPSQAFEMVLEPDLLRLDRSGSFPSFSELPSEGKSKVFEEFFTAIHEHFKGVRESGDFEKKKEDFGAWNKPRMEKQKTNELLALFKEEREKAEKDMETKGRLQALRREHKLFPPASPKSKRKIKDKKKGKKIAEKRKKMGSLRKKVKPMAKMKETNTRWIQDEFGDDAIGDPGGAMKTIDEVEEEIAEQLRQARRSADAASVSVSAPQPAGPAMPDASVEDLKQRLLRIRAEDTARQERRSSQKRSVETS